jgi:hypothetical protein
MEAYNMYLITYSCSHANLWCKMSQLRRNPLHTCHSDRTLKYKRCYLEDLFFYQSTFLWYTDLQGLLIVSCCMSIIDLSIGVFRMIIPEQSECVRHFDTVLLLCLNDNEIWFDVSRLLHLTVLYMIFFLISVLLIVLEIKVAQVLFQSTRWMRL